MVRLDGTQMLALKSIHASSFDLNKIPCTFGNGLKNSEQIFIYKSMTQNMHYNWTHSAVFVRF